MSIYVSKLTAGTNNHQETSENANALATDFVSEGVIGAITNTSGVAPLSGAFATNAQNTPDMTIKVSAGVAYVKGTPTGQDSQVLRVRMTADANLTISSNSTGSTKYDWVYIKLDADKMANPAVDADDVATLVTSRSSSSTADNGTPPTYGYPIAIVVVADSTSSILNSNITDKRALSKSTQNAWRYLGSAINTSTQSITSTSPAALPTGGGLSCTVAIPSDINKVKLTLIARDAISPPSNAMIISIWRGAIGSGTQVSESKIGTSTSATATEPLTIIALDGPSAGSVTYNVAAYVTANTGGIDAVTAMPITLLVEGY